MNNQKLSALAGFMAAVAFYLSGCGSPSFALEPMKETIDRIETQLIDEAVALAPLRKRVFWLDDTRSVIFSGTAGTARLDIVDVDGGMTPVTLHKSLRQALKASEALEKSWMLPRAEGFSRIESDVFAFSVAGRRFALDSSRAETRDLTTDEVTSMGLNAPRYVGSRFPSTFPPQYEYSNPTRTFFASTEGRNIYLRSAGADQKRPLTDETDPLATWGGVDFATEAIAYPFGMKWSPNGRYLAATRRRHAAPPSHPLVHWTEPSPVTEIVHYTRPGDPLPEYSVGVFDVVEGRFLSPPLQPKRDHIYGPLLWDLDNRRLIIAELRRDGREWALYAWSIDTSEVQRLGDDLAAAVLDGLMINKPFYLEALEGGEYLALWEKSDAAQLFRFDPDGRAVRQATTSALPISDVVAIDHEERFIYYRAASGLDRPYDLKLYKQFLEGGEPVLLTPQPGRHEVTFSPSLRVFVSTASAPAVQPSIRFIGVDGAVIAEVKSRDAGQEMDRIGFSGVEELFVPTEDGASDIYMQIYRPRGFRPDKRYPVIEIVYGGPQWDHTPHHHYGAWRSMNGAYRMLPRILQREGFVVVFVNAPGTVGRGRLYQRKELENWPGDTVANHAYAIRKAASERPWMDVSRVGVWGNSYGGYMAQRALIEAGDLYNVAVSMGPVSDLADQPAIGEMLIGDRVENKEAYLHASNLDKAEHITGKLLLVPHPLDVNAPFSAGVKMLDAMIRAGKDVDFFFFPGVNHHIRCCGEDTELYAYAYILRYFKEHL